MHDHQRNGHQREGQQHQEHQDDGHHHNGHEHKETAVKEYEVIAQFPSDTQVQRAERAIHDHVRSTHIERMDEHSTTRPEEAEMGVSTVEIGAFAWFGLVVGLVIGAVLGWLTFAGTITLPGIAPALGAGPTAMIALGAGILGAIGWLMGALAHLYRGSASPPQHELHAVVEEETWQQVGQTLVDAGAVTVLVPMGDGQNGGRSEEAHHHH